MSRKQPTFWHQVHLLVKSVSPRIYSRIVVLILLVLLGLMTTLTLPALTAQPVEKTTVTSTQISNAQGLLQQGIKHYQAEQFAEAVKVWQEAATVFARQKDNLNQALVLSNLSLAYQHLRQWEEAKKAIAKSLTLLENPKNFTDNQVYLEVRAKALNTQGHLQWEEGKLEPALETWKQAALNYAKIGNERGIVISKINQAKALQALGLSRKAEELLQQVYQNLQQKPDSDLKATGLRNLGQALRRIGELERSQAVLQESIKIAQLPSPRSSALLELGNTERALGNRALALDENIQTEQHTKAALKAYQDAIYASNSPFLQLPAQLNQFSLLLESGQWLQAEELRPKLQNAIANLPTSRATIYARLNFANNLTCLKQITEQDDLSCLSSLRQNQLREKLPAPELGRAIPSWSEIIQILASSLQQARDLNDRLAESYALGQLGGLYEVTEQLSEAQNFTEQALFIAQRLHIPELLYRWQWQLGRLLEKQGDTENAIATNQRAVQTLESVRNDLLTLNSDVQFSFRDDVEPVYRRLIDLLLSKAQPSQQNLEQALAAIDSLRLTELENFLRCDLSPNIKVEQVVTKIDPKAALISPIILEKRLEIIFKLPQQPLVHRVLNLSRLEMEKTINRLQNNLTRPEGTKEVREDAQRLYNWLIKPLEEDLEPLRKRGQVTTLVFVLDGSLRNIPMSVLYNQGQYLVQNYAVAVIPSRQLFDPRSRQAPLKVLAAGVSEAQTVEGIEFQELPYVPRELNRIKQVTESPDEPLLNRAFTNARLEQQIDSATFPIVHIATHGEFSSDPDETYILAWGERLKVKDFERLLQVSRPDSSQVLELLILSACQTAKGNRRAALGLAGVAAQARVRTTVATLWQVDDQTTAELMRRFYEGLKQGETIAEALRQAELSLLTQGENRPYYWAPFVLVGNWL